MKRASSGKSTSRATPARRPTVRRKAKPAKTTTARRPPAKRKVARKQPAPPTAPPPPASVARTTKPRTTSSKPTRQRAAKKTTPSAKRKTAARKSAARKTAGRRHSPNTLAADQVAPPPAAPVSIPAPQPIRSRAARKRTPARPTATIPAFLLEGDEPSPSELSGPGEKFSLGPTPPLDHFDEARAPLPESYGTGRLYLTVRDPHWLYTNWDFTRAEQFRHNARSVDRHLVIRVHAATQPAAPVAEYHVHPESKHWFVHVERAGETYTTELGYYLPQRQWKSLAYSAPKRTPPDQIAADHRVQFATIPAELPFDTMLALLRETEGLPVETIGLARAIQGLRYQLREHFADPTPMGEWTPAQADALTELLTAATPRAHPSSPESGFTVGLDSSPGPGSNEYGTSASTSFFSSPGGSDFWFNINAELIVYGATEPHATVTCAGQPVALQPDGSFRFRFALPDGNYALPLTAHAATHPETRAVTLHFTRATESQGTTAATPDPILQSPPEAAAPI